MKRSRVVKILAIFLLITFSSRLTSGLLRVNKVALVIGSFAYLLFMITTTSNMPILTVTCLFAYVSYVVLLISLSKVESRFYNTGNLGISVFIYGFLILSVFLYVSFMYEGDTFLFNKVDAKTYEYGSMLMANMPFDAAFNYLSRQYQFDDWGAFIVMSSVLSIIPDKLFLNFFYLIIGTITAVTIFKMCTRIMLRKYAYMSAISYCISSFAVSFYGFFLKETFFIFLVVGSMYFFMKYVTRGNFLNFILAIIVSLFIVFFRPAVVLFLWISFASYFLFGARVRIPKVFKLLIIVVIAAQFAVSAMEMASSYSMGGEFLEQAATRENERSGSSGIFMFLVVGIGTLLGPFPTLIATESNSPITVLYAPGLLYKLFLALPFWMAVIYSIREKIYKILPLIVFVIIESLHLILIQQGLELRKGLPHVFAFYIVAFWYLSQIEEGKIKGKLYHKLFPYSCILIALIILGWNMR